MLHTSQNLVLIFDTGIDEWTDLDYKDRVVLSRVANFLVFMEMNVWIGSSAYTPLSAGSFCSPF